MNDQNCVLMIVDRTTPILNKEKFSVTVNAT